MTDKPRLPSDTHHVAIAGRTGSGKTVAALEMLSKRDFTKQAWIIVDHKGDDNIAKLPAERLAVNSRFLPQSGLHIVRPTIAKASREALDDLLTKIREKGNIGVYIDEGHLVGASEPLRHLLVAGRQHKTPVMFTSQRAAHIDTFVWSQASFYRVFALQTAADIKRFNENFPIKFRNLPEFHSHYYDVAKGKIFHLSASQPLSATLQTFDNKLLHAYRMI